MAPRPTTRRSVELQNSRAWSRWILFTDRAAEFVHSSLTECFSVERQRANEQLVQHDPERIHIASSVDVYRAWFGLLRTHVLRRPHEPAEFRDQRLLREGLSDCFSDSEVDDPWHGMVINLGHEHVRGLQVAMNDSFLMCMLDTLAQMDEEFEPLGDREPPSIAVNR